MSDSDQKGPSVIVDESLAKEYSRINGVSLEIARKNLAENFQREAKGVDLSQQYDALIKAFRAMSPQLNGVVSRESDTAAAIKSLNSRMQSIESEFEELLDTLQNNQDVFKQAILLLNDANKKKPSLLARIGDRIKCFLKR